MHTVHEASGSVENYEKCRQKKKYPPLTSGSRMTRILDHVSGHQARGPKGQITDPQDSVTACTGAKLWVMRGCGDPNCLFGDIPEMEGAETGLVTTLPHPQGTSA